jgi:predicted small secreted protein
LRRVITPLLLLAFLVCGCTTTVDGSGSGSSSVSSSQSSGSNTSSSTSNSNSTQRNTNCVNGDCTISLSGEQTFRLDVGRLERQVRVGPIGEGEVTLSVGPEQVVAAEGDTVVLDGVQFAVSEVADGAVEMSAQAA